MLHNKNVYQEGEILSFVGQMDPLMRLSYIPKQNCHAVKVAVLTKMQFQVIHLHTTNEDTWDGY